MMKIGLADIAAANGQHCIEREVTDEHGKPAEDDPLHVGKKAVAPVDRRMQRLLTRRGRPRPKPRKREPLIQ
jgi:hypothetical protein